MLLVSLWLDPRQFWRKVPAVILTKYRIARAVRRPFGVSSLFYWVPLCKPCSTSSRKRSWRWTFRHLPSCSSVWRDSGAQFFACWSCIRSSTIYQATTTGPMKIPGIPGTWSATTRQSKLPLGSISFRFSFTTSLRCWSPFCSIPSGTPSWIISVPSRCGVRIWLFSIVSPGHSARRGRYTAGFRWPAWSFCCMERQSTTRQTLDRSP
mmetsp:Transcript_5220/g.12445  ORF Transcript_5220/g.12445 Transcript_5220/m.12445 type:complete len:208 (+) Transcript_5220:230-853(+)